MSRSWSTFWLCWFSTRPRSPYRGKKSLVGHQKEKADVAGENVGRYDGLPMYPVDPYVEAALQAPPSLDYVPGLEEPKQASPSLTTYQDQSYIVDADPEEDLEDESEDGPTDYLANRGDDDDNSFGDDANEEDEEDASKEDEDEEEHLAPADSTTVSLAVDISHSWENIAIPLPPTHTSPTYAEAPLGNKAARIRLRAALPPTLPLPTLPPPSLPLLLPSTDRRADVPEAVLSPRKRLCLAPGPRFEVRESSSAASARTTGGYRAYYRFIGTLDAELRRDRTQLIVALGRIDILEVKEPTHTKDADSCSTDKTKITRKQSKTGKHGHEKRKSTREAKDSEPKPEKMVKPQSKKVNPSKEKSTHKRTNP
ncbi:hypothetical protein Tco_0691685 [Tanacetum coccineum]